MTLCKGPSPEGKVLTMPGAIHTWNKELKNLVKRRNSLALFSDTPLWCQMAVGNTVQAARYCVMVPFTLNSQGWLIVRNMRWAYKNKRSVCCVIALIEVLEFFLLTMKKHSPRTFPLILRSNCWPNMHFWRNMGYSHNLSIKWRTKLETCSKHMLWV